MKIQTGLLLFSSASKLLCTVVSAKDKPILEKINHKKAFSLLHEKLKDFGSMDATEKHEKENLRKGRTQTQEKKQRLQDSDESVFTAAPGISHFRDQIDEDVFEWFNKDHVRAGYTTCGYLKPFLGVDEHEPFPKINVKFCVRFADVQPAAKGNLAIHCGGPGSLSGCMMVESVGKDNLENYNIISFDQRGMGMSWPSFAHEECTYGTTEINGTLVQTGMGAFEVDATNESSIQEFLDQQKNRVFSCWACQTCDFHLPATGGIDKTYHFLEYSGTRQVVQDLDTFRQAIGADKLSLYGVSYGTQVMATYATMFPENTDKFVIDANVPPRPDLYSFASVIAENNHQRQSYLAYTCTLRNKIIPGSCNIDLNYCFQETFNFYEEVFHSIGVLQFESAFFALFSRSSILDTFSDACDAARDKDVMSFLYALITLETEWLPGPLSTCFTGIFDVAVDLLDIVGVPGNVTDGAKGVGLAAYSLLGSVDYEMCHTFVDNTNNKAQQVALVYELWEKEYEASYSPNEDTSTLQHSLQSPITVDDADCTGPTYEDWSYPFLLVECVGGDLVAADEIMKPYSAYMSGVAAVPQTMVLAQSMSGSSYDDKHVIQLVQEVYAKYGGGFYGENSAASFFFWYTIGFYWPKAQPVPPAGDMTVTGIVAGQLYDYVTAYEFTQDMKAAFPSTTLITSQWTQHGFHRTQATHGDGGDEILDSTCQIYINNYFETGLVGVVDGFTCGSLLPDPFGDF